MKYLLIPLMCFLAVTKVTLQSQFSKSKKLNVADNIFYNFVMFSASAIILLPWLITKRSSPDTYIFGAVSGVLSVCFQLSYLFAFSKGKPVLVTTINNFSMFIPIAVSCIFFGDEFSMLKFIALIFASISIVMITSKKGAEVTTKSNIWILFAFMAFLTCGLMSSVQKVYSNLSDNFDVFSFVATTYVTASILSFIALKFTTKRSDTEFKLTKEPIISASIAGVFLGIFQCVSTYSASVINGVILYSVYNCSTNILFAFVRMVFFKERLTKKQVGGVISGIISILFMQ